MRPLVVVALDEVIEARLLQHVDRGWAARVGGVYIKDGDNGLCCMGDRPEETRLLHWFARPPETVDWTVKDRRTAQCSCDDGVVLEDSGRAMEVTIRNGAGETNGIMCRPVVEIWMRAERQPGQPQERRRFRCYSQQPARRRRLAPRTANGPNVS